MEAAARHKGGGGSQRAQHQRQQLQEAGNRKRKVADPDGSGSGAVATPGEGAPRKKLGRKKQAMEERKRLAALQAAQEQGQPPKGTTTAHAADGGAAATSNKKKKGKKTKKAGGAAALTAAQQQQMVEDEVAAFLGEDGMAAMAEPVDMVENAQDIGSDGEGPEPSNDDGGGDVAAAGDDDDDDEPALRPLQPPASALEAAGAAGRAQRAAVRAAARFGALPKWLKTPTVVDCSLDSDSNLAVDEVQVLSSRLRETLKKQGVTRLFPIQAAAVPAIIQAHALPNHAQDSCIMAPTGSGKTLTYVLPVVECLRQRVIRRLRALVVLPTRDLALQVKRVFDVYCQGAASKTHPALRVGVTVGAVSVAKEQQQLVDSSDPEQSPIDVLVTTPGRLIEHLEGTAGFTLEHLEFLVIDEADRLLSQSYQDWLPAVLRSAHQPRPADPPQPVLASPFALYSHSTHTYRDAPEAAVSVASMKRLGKPLQKMLFSATLTHDPEKLATLHLVHPRLFATLGTTTAASTPQAEDAAEGGATGDAAHAPGASLEKRFVVPESLREFYIVCAAAEKPLALLHLLETEKLQRTLVFTASLEATHRLCLLLQAMGCNSVAEFSSTLSTSQRASLVQKVKDGLVDVLVCSDVMARGMDLEGVDNVVCYDSPKFAQTYIHRVGRTARAGQLGSAYTILRSEEARHFKGLRRQIAGPKPRQLRLKESLYAPFAERYQQGLARVQEQVAAEKHAPPSHGNPQRRR